MKKQTNSKSEYPPSEELPDLLNSDPELGLSSKEAQKRLEKFGPNVLKKQKKQNFFVLFVKQLCEMMSILLLIAGLIALGLAIYQNIAEPTSNTIALSYAQAGILLFIVIINGLFGSIQEAKSNNAIEELEKMSSPQAKVIRDSKMIMIDSSQIVLGDIMVVEAGDFIPADAKLIEASSLKCIESALTGESEPVEKNLNVIDDNVPLGEQKNKIFSGTQVVNGRAVAVVIGTSNNTEIGKVADLLSDKEGSMTPLQYKLHKLGKMLGWVGIVITFLTFLFSLLVIEDVITTGFDAVQPSLILAVSLAAAAIPEGLSAVVNIILSIGVKRMSNKNALIKKLPAVETLGSTAIICSDKTGTLTMNKMTVVKLWVDGENEDFDETKNERKVDLLKYLNLCTDAQVDEDNEKAKSIGDPTEIALLDAAIKWDFSPDQWDDDYDRIADIPFDSDRKLMTSINIIEGEKIAIVKGAPDVLISRCNNVDVNHISVINNKWSDNAIRVLALGIKKVSDKEIQNLDQDEIEKNLTFIGLVGMIDPPREEVRSSIAECINAGIKPVMITGDHLNTAVAIAKDLGIIFDEQKQKAITGEELSNLDDKTLEEHINDYSVFARVSPEDKIKIVKAWQKRDQVVAMTGDGVNDAPALKAADIGCAMGITGTDVSKSAADMILTDDNFATIVESVKSGRGTYENIRKIVKFLLSSNVAGIISIVIGMMIFYFVFSLAGWGALSADCYNGHILSSEQANYFNSQIKFNSTLTTIQILINNIVIETLPGVALGIQDVRNDLMNNRPRSKYESIFADKLISKILITGIINGLMTIVAFTIGAQIAISNGEFGLRFFYGNVAAFFALTIGGILKSISMSSKNIIFKAKWEESKWVYLSCVISLMIIFISTLVPQIASLFGERPEITSTFVDEMNNPGSTANQFDMDSIKNSFFGGQDKNSFINPYIILIGIIAGLIPFIVLEIEKIVETKDKSNNKNEKIKEFKLIEKPIPFSKKYPFFARFTKD